MQNTESQVQIASKGLAPFHRTKLDIEFVRKHCAVGKLTSQESVIMIVLLGEGVWWKIEDGHYIFFDGDSDPNFKEEMIFSLNWS